MGAVRHFLRVDPESLERKDEDWGSRRASELKLETSEKMSDPVIHAIHKLGMCW